MNPSPRPDPIAHLRIERRSYIVGTLVVWFVIIITGMILYANMKPELFHQPPASTLGEAMARAEKISPLSVQQQLLLELVFFVGAIALFFLNWRFSAVIQRPRRAFAATPGAGSAGRWMWWLALALNSYFFFPQLLVTPLLAHWGSEEIRRRLSASASNFPGPSL